MRFLPVVAMLLGPALLSATQHSGSVRAADQFIPGATVTARNGGAKVVAYTDQEGRYSMDLTPGVWEIQVEMFGFTTSRANVTVADQPGSRDWTLEMPRFGEKGAEASKAAAIPPTPQVGAVPATGRGQGRGQGRFGQGQGQGQAQGQERRRFGDGRGPGGQQQQAGAGRGPNGPQQQGGPAGRGGRGGPQSQQQQQGFQNMSVTATEEGQQALASAAMDTAPPDLGGDASDSFLVTGSMSGGLGAAADEQARRERMMGGRGGPGGPDGMGPGGMGPGMGMMGGGFGDPSAFGGAGMGGDPLGMGGFGAAGVNAGFGADNGGGFGPGGGGGGRGGPGGGRGAFGGGPGGGGGGFGGGGGGGGAGGRGGGRGQAAGGRGGRGGRGPFNGQFAAFGNRRRTQPLYTGNAMINLANSALNAAPFSLNGQPVTKPSYGQSNFSVTFGGPLRIPKIYSNDRWNFNLSYQGSRSRNPFNQVASLPTAAERGGDFSQAFTNNKAVEIYDPLTHSPFPGNIIPVNRFNSASVGLLKYFPQPLFSGIIQNYQLVTSTPRSSDSLGVRLNAPLSTKDRLNFNEQYSRNNGENAQLFGFRDTSSGYGLSASVGWSHSFKPRFNSNLNLQFSRNISKGSPYFAYTNNVAAELGINGTSQDPINYGPPNLSFTNFGGLSDGSASVNRSQTTAITENLTYVVRRRHNLTFGFGYRKMQQNALSYANSRGAFSFSGLLTSGFDPNGQPLAGTGFDFADFLLGLPQTSSLRIGNSNNYFRGWAANGYVQDDWRARPNLSFNLGLRYEYFSPYTELRGHLANLDLSPGRDAISVVTPGVGGPYSGDFPASLINGDPNNFSPRIGFSFRPSQKHSRIIHGGYSIFFQGGAYGGFASRMAAQPPFATTASLSTTTANPLTLQNGFPTAPSQTITNTYAVDRDFKLGYAQTWTIAVQQTLPHNLLMEVEYVATKGTGLDITEQPNRAIAGSSPANAQLKIANSTGFSYETSQGNSIFHSGQTRITRRFNRGMSAVVLYTFSKSIDNASSFGGGGGVVAQFTNNLAAERGLSTFDQRHKLSVQYTLSSPVGIHGLWRNGGWKTKAFTGWTLSGGYTATSGTPLTARVSGNVSNVGGTAAFGSGRAEATGQDINAGAFPYFNLLAFTLPPAGQYGNAGRNTIPGLFHMGLNASLNRAWRLGDTRRQIQMSINANNALNHVTITNIGTTVNSSNFGLATGASGTRTVTLRLRVNF